jgi:hypothetical protein
MNCCEDPDAAEVEHSQTGHRTTVMEDDDGREIGYCCLDCDWTVTIEEGES